MTEFTIGDAALALARTGFSVFPVRVGAKTPGVRQWPRFATTDPRRVREWWSRVPTLNVGIYTGGSNLVVIDCDAGKPWDLAWGEQPPGVTSGADALVALAETTGNLGDGSWMFDAPTVVTPSGGIHLFYRAPDGVRLGPSAGVVAPWVDVRAGVSYVVGPWSQTPQGHYRPDDAWRTVRVGDLDVEWTVSNARLARVEVDIPPLPGWLTGVIADASSKVTGPTVFTDRWARLTAMLDAPRGTSAYFDAALDDAYRNVSTAGEGRRNATLTKETFSLAGLIPHLAEDVIRDRMFDAARTCGLEAQEAAACIGAAIRRGKASPRLVTGYA